MDLCGSLLQGRSHGRVSAARGRRFHPARPVRSAAEPTPGRRPGRPPFLLGENMANWANSSSSGRRGGHEPSSSARKPLAILRGSPLRPPTTETPSYPARGRRSPRWHRSAADAFERSSGKPRSPREGEGPAAASSMEKVSWGVPRCRNRYSRRSCSRPAQRKSADAGQAPQGGPHLRRGQRLIAEDPRAAGHHHRPLVRLRQRSRKPSRIPP